MNVRSILEGEVTTPDTPLSDEQAFAILKQMGRELKAKHIWIKNVYEGNDEVFNPELEKWMAQADHAINFMVNAFNQDQCIAGLKVFLQDFCLPLKVIQMQSIRNFGDKYCSIVLNMQGYGPLGESWASAASENGEVAPQETSAS